MKFILLIRHAKSSWNFNVADFDRPLNDRGKKDAPEMAKRLLKRDLKIDAFISSPANRAITTATYFAEVYGKKAKNIITEVNLYEPEVEAFYNVLKNLDDELKTVAIFSHNPTITTFANKLTDIKVDNMPTCAVFALKADIKKWKDFMTTKKEFLFFDYPKAS